MSALLEVDSLSVVFGGSPAVDDVSFRLRTGESVALVGGSGAGKSTVARAIAGLVSATSGRIVFDDVDLTTASTRAGRTLRRGMHLVFQDPYASLPPGMRVGDIVAEPMVIHRIGEGTARRDSVLDALASVRLTPAADFVDRYQHELSGGQRQRVAFARALVTRPRLLLADEPTSGLDASLRVEIVDLMSDLARTQDLAVLHITHDLALAARSCDAVMVMQDGVVVETGSSTEVLTNPSHRYTAALVAAATGAQ